MTEPDEVAVERLAELHPDDPLILLVNYLYEQLNVPEDAERSLEDLMERLRLKFGRAQRSASQWEGLCFKLWNMLGMIGQPDPRLLNNILLDMNRELVELRVFQKEVLHKRAKKLH